MANDEAEEKIGGAGRQKEYIVREICGSEKKEFIRASLPATQQSTK